MEDMSSGLADGEEEGAPEVDDLYVRVAVGETRKRVIL